MSLFSFISLLCSFKTNIPNIVCFVFLVIQYAILAASNWIAADGNTAAAGRLNVVRTQQSNSIVTRLTTA